MPSRRTAPRCPAAQTGGIRQRRNRFGTSSSIPSRRLRVRPTPLRTNLSANRPALRKRMRETGSQIEPIRTRDAAVGPEDEETEHRFLTSVGATGACAARGHKDCDGARLLERNRETRESASPAEVQKRAHRLNMMPRAEPPSSIGRIEPGGLGATRTEQVYQGGGARREEPGLRSRRLQPRPLPHEQEHECQAATRLPSTVTTSMCAGGARCAGAGAGGEHTRRRSPRADLTEARAILTPRRWYRNRSHRPHSAGATDTCAAELRRGQRVAKSPGADLGSPEPSRPSISTISTERGDVQLFGSPGEGNSVVNDSEQNYILNTRTGCRTPFSCMREVSTPPKAPTNNIVADKSEKSSCSAERDRVWRGGRGFRRRLADMQGSVLPGAMYSGQILTHALRARRLCLFGVRSLVCPLDKQPWGAGRPGGVVWVPCRSSQRSGGVGPPLCCEAASSAGLVDRHLFP